MGFNMYKQLEKIKVDLEGRGFTVDIPVSEFGRTLMKLFGMKRETATKWIRNFEELNLISVINQKINFMKV